MEERNLAFTVVVDILLVIHRARGLRDVSPGPHVLPDDNLQVLPVPFGSLEIVGIIRLVPQLPCFKPRLVVRNRDRPEQLKVLRVVVENTGWEDRVMADGN